MATVIKCIVEGINNPLELDGGLSFGYDSTADVRNPETKKVTFGPITVSPFSFSIVEPKPDDAKALIEWLVTHKVKSKVTFKISDQDIEAKTRDIELEQVCLESYSENISEIGRHISLEMIGQKVKVDGITVDQTKQR